MRRYHLPILTVTLLALAGVVYFYYKVSPYNDEQIAWRAVGILLLFVGAVITGVYTLVTYPIKKLLHPSWDARSVTRTSLRQGHLIATGIVILVLLSITDILNLATAGLTIVSLIAIEGFFRQ